MKTYDDMIRKYNLAMEVQLEGFRYDESGWLHSKFQVTIKSPRGEFSTEYKMGTGFLPSLQKSGFNTGTTLWNGWAPKLDLVLNTMVKRGLSVKLKNQEDRDTQCHILKLYYQRLNKDGQKYGPKLNEVLDCLRGDIECAAYPSHEVFSEEFGYGKDSIKGLRVYEACKETRDKMLNAFGFKFVDELLQCERL